MAEADTERDRVNRLPQNTWIVYAVIAGLLLLVGIGLSMRAVAYFFSGQYVH
jgi:hypothetical protein